MASPPRIVVVGSLNTDLVIKAPELPRAGETVSGGTFAIFAGGKGANQAVAAARLGAAVTMVGCLGDDDFGRGLRSGLASEGIDAELVRVQTGVASGVALIVVDPQGRNMIAVAPGANHHLSVLDVEAARPVLEGCQALLLQLEVPYDAVVTAAGMADRAGCRVILDPAPASAYPVDRALLEQVGVITPNEVEAQILTGFAVSTGEDVARVGERLLALGARAAIIKLGSRGAFVAAPGVREVIPALSVEAVDTTAAGDAFSAALAVALAEGRDLVAAARFATAAAALSVTRMGAQPSLPRRGEVIAFARERGVPVD